jgi:hypothetical protein
MNAVIIEDEFHSREFLKNVLAELFLDMPLMGTPVWVSVGTVVSSEGNSRATAR